MNFEDADLKPILPPNLRLLAPRYEVSVTCLVGFAGWAWAPLGAAAYAGEVRELDVGESEDAGAVVQGGGGWANVVLRWKCWWHSGWCFFGNVFLSVGLVL